MNLKLILKCLKQKGERKVKEEILKIHEYANIHIFARENLFLKIYANV